MRVALEREMRAVGRLLAEQDFESREEMNLFLQEMASQRNIPNAVPETPRDQAQDLIYQARLTSNCGVDGSRQGSVYALNRL